MAKAKKRTYRRRSDAERISDLEKKIEDMRRKVETKQRQDQPVLKDIPRVQRRLQRFAKLAMDHGRADLANSTSAFIAGLERTRLDGSPPSRRRVETSDED